MKLFHRKASVLPPVPDAPLLRVRGLCVSYGTHTVLHHLPLSLRRGELVALLGPNGSGKTTLLRALSGVITPQSGSVELSGHALADLDTRERARRVAVVPQRQPYPRQVTARQFVLLGRFAHLSWLGAYGANDYAAAERALEETEAAALADRPMARLSGGETQRVLLARALVQESPLLLLDELTAGLDLARMVDICALLERRRAAGMGILMAIHDANVAALYASRLLGLREGRLLFDGTVTDVFTEEHLSALYAVPVAVVPHPQSGIPQVLANPCTTLRHRHNTQQKISPATGQTHGT